MHASNLAQAYSHVHALNLSNLSVQLSWES